MKILHTVESYLPAINGMVKVVQELSERLAQKGHQLTVATSYHPQRTQSIINKVKINQFKIKGKAVTGYQAEKKELQRYQDFLLQSDFDIITNFAAQQWATDLALPILSRIKAKKVFVPTGFSGLYLPVYKTYFKKMPCWMKKYDMNVFLSNNYRDINFARENGVKKRVLIPNGASAEEFLSAQRIDMRKQLGIPPGHFLIMLVGAHTGAKGHRETIDIFRKATITNATLLIVANPSWNRCARHCFLTKYIFNVLPKRRVDKKQLIITSLSRQETINAYKIADLFLFPSNIECYPLVLFEAMASKTPFLVTDVGNSKEIIDWSKSGKLLPTMIGLQGFSHAQINQSAKVLENIYNNKYQREIMAESGYKAWQKQFTWEKITKRYEKLYQSLLK